MYDLAIVGGGPGPAGDGAWVAVNIISGQKGERYVWHDVLPPRP